jgi:hypothetical protein
MQLRAFLAQFLPERILIATSEALKEERAATLARMFRFIGVAPRFEDPDFARLVNQTPPAPASGQDPETPAWPVLERADRDRLAEHLAVDLEDLRALTGLRFEPGPSKEAAPRGRRERARHGAERRRRLRPGHVRGNAGRGGRSWPKRSTGRRGG